MDFPKSHNMVALMDDDLANEFEVLALEAVSLGKTIIHFNTEVRLLFVRHDYSEDLDNELWTMAKHRDETVVKFSQRH